MIASVCLYEPSKHAGVKGQQALCFDMRFPEGGMTGCRTQTETHTQRESLKRLEVMLMFTS